MHLLPDRPPVALVHSFLGLGISGGWILVPLTRTFGQVHADDVVVMEAGGLLLVLLPVYPALLPASLLARLRTFDRTDGMRIAVRIRVDLRTHIRLLARTRRLRARLEEKYFSVSHLH